MGHWSRPEDLENRHFLSHLDSVSGGWGRKTAVTHGEAWQKSTESSTRKILTCFTTDPLSIIKIMTAASKFEGGQPSLNRVRKMRLAAMALCALMIVCSVAVYLAGPGDPIHLDFVTVKNDPKLGALGIFEVSNVSTQRFSASGRMLTRLDGIHGKTYGADLGGVLTIPAASTNSFKVMIPSTGNWKLSLYCWPESQLPSSTPAYRRWLVSVIGDLPLNGRLKYRIQELLGPLRVLRSRSFQIPALRE